MSPHTPDRVRGKSIDLSGIAKSYGSTRVLDRFDLSIPAGSFCTLLGASGSGKSTLLKLIAGFEPPDAGRIRIDGHDMTGVPTARRNIGMVFQNYALFPHMRVRANVAFGLDMRGVARAESRRRVDETLALVGLADQAERYPRELSGGQQQRVALARALVIRPDILLMDEPLGALDKNLRQALQLELKLLQMRLGITIAFVTHDQEEALHLSDLIVVLNHGLIEQMGTPRELYLRPRNRFVATFLGECNCRDVDGALVGIRPEKLRLRSSATGDDRQLACEVTHVTFLGNGLRVGLRHGEETLIALTDADAPGQALTVGATVHVDYDPADEMPLGTAALA